MRTYMTKPQLVKDIKSSLPGLFASGKFDLIFKIRVWNLLVIYYKDRGLIPRNANWSYPKPKSTKHDNINNLSRTVNNSDIMDSTKD